MSARRLVTFLAALVVVQGLFLSALHAQAVTATVKGRVVDTDGSGLPGVVVVIKSKTQPSGNKQVVTDIEGNYRIPLLPPANDYYIKVDYPGFAPMELGPLDLDAGKTTVADLTLRTSAETTETIVVESKGNIVDTEGTKTASSYNAEFIEGLPIIGSNYQDILLLAPGVTDTDGDGNPNVHGARDTGLQYRLDGGNVTDPFDGGFGQNLNADIIEELEVITSGASAEYGRADGGFANVITKSGGNEFEGKFSIRWRGKFLNGNGVLDRNDVNKYDDQFEDYHDIRPSLYLGGAIVKDKLWYVGSLQVFDVERPVAQLGLSRLPTLTGHEGFAKVTWQANSYNKLALQVLTDPLTFRGNNIGVGVSPDSDYTATQGGPVPQIKWTSTISPQLLLESTVTRFNTNVSFTPVSDFFEPTVVETLQTSPTIIQAKYPCDVLNCNPQRGERKIYQIDLINGTINGPYFFKNDDDRVRNSIKTDLQYSVEDAWGQHNIKSGIEFGDEKYRDNPLLNPFLTDVTTPFNPPPGSQGTGGGIILDQIQGVQQLTTFQPLITPQRATSFNTGVYLTDAWKPLPNLTVNAGLRIDREDIDSSGFDFFNPRDERRAAIRLWEQICAAARDQNLPGSTPGENCGDPTRYNGEPPIFPNADAANGLRTDRPGIPVTPRVASLDLNQDGWIESNGPEGDAFYRDFTRFEERNTSNFQIVNTNLSPRFSISWDPWADGKTKFFGTWGRFHDRLFLSTVAQEIGPDRVNFLFVPDSTNHIIRPGDPSVAASTVSITQTERGLRTPRTDEYTLGIERELAPEWSASFTFIKRKGYDLLQDVDLNHITCGEHLAEFGIDPFVICENETDKFGATGVFSGSSGGGGGTEGGSFFFDPTGGGRAFPNGAPDLYTVNPRFNEVLRVTNSNSFDYQAYELKVVKRLHRNWQMQASYTWSEAVGQAEEFLSDLGNDPQTKDDEEGYLSFDQRHILKFQAVTQLPKEIKLGTTIQWASGIPYSVQATVIDVDRTGNTIFRTFYPTRQRNDQRNEGQWKIDGKLEKAFTIGRVQASAFMTVENLLDTDDLTITEFDLTSLDGLSLEGFRDIGRRFELGAVFSF